MPVCIFLGGCLQTMSCRGKNRDGMGPQLDGQSTMKNGDWAAWVDLAYTTLQSILPNVTHVLIDNKNNPHNNNNNKKHLSWLGSGRQG